MQILIGFLTLASIAGVLAIFHYGIVRAERKFARWLLLDARAWEARKKAKRENAAAVAEVI